MKSLTSLFLSQSYSDAWADYNRSIVRAGFVHWDFVILTASNEQQAEGFRAQLEEREAAGFLPKETHFAVIPDPDGKRVGSGGATLGVIRYISECIGSNDFSGLRILVIHSGGDSKRVPQYSALGKLFSPVPHELPNGRASTLFDEFMIVMSTVPSRFREGMLLLSGDVLLLFNPLLIDYSGVGAAAISFKEKVQIGKNHGVFLSDDDGNVKAFLHKKPVEKLRELGAVNSDDCVDIDTGAVIFSKDMLASLYNLISDDGVVTDESFERYVNDKVRLSLYGDFMYPLASEAKLDDYHVENPEGEFCGELIEARTDVWNELRKYRLKVLHFAPAKFIHFGTTKEIMELMSSEINEYKELEWRSCINSSISNDAQGRVAGYNSALSAKASYGSFCYLESSYVHSTAKLGDNVLLSYIDIKDVEIPSNVVMHGLKQKDGRFVARIYGIEDNPKDEDYKASLMGVSFRKFVEDNDIAVEELWDTREHTVWNAKLYPACDNIHEAVKASLNLYRLVHGEGDIEAWRNADRKSLCSGFNEADSHALIAWDKHMQEIVQMNKIKIIIREGRSVSEVNGILRDSRLTPVQQEWLDKHVNDADFSERIRLLYYFGVALGGAEGESLIASCFEEISNTIIESVREKIRYNDGCRIACNRHVVKLPLRVNWGGGWSDTPPYSNERGGTVLNAAILLNGELPVEVSLEKLDDNKIVFDSRDMDVHGEFTDINELQKTGDPYDPFALQKAALLACGIIPVEGGDLESILKRLGGGFIMCSEVTGVPKGSGLGTSSILAGACVKALYDFVGIAYDDALLYDTVLCMEQIMSTGGGWQDQVGGLTNGIKYITTMPGICQQIKVEHVQLPEETERELKERFALIYTGQRRLARNLLRDVVGRYIGCIPDSLYSLNEIQRNAALMRFELSRGNIDAFARLMCEHWELSKLVDKGSSNTLIDQIFESIEPLIDGKMICGAGGGGFLQVILKKGVTREALHDRLNSVFQDTGIDVWDCELV